jgi:hypothetical protein
MAGFAQSTQAIEVSDWNGEMCICAQGYNVLLFLIFI